MSKSGVVVVRHGGVVVWDKATADHVVRALTALEVQWRRLGAPIAKALEPGISAEEIDLLAAPYGLEIPGELKALWGWHNGARAIAPGRGRWTVGPGGYEFLSAQSSLEGYALNRRVHEESPGDDPLLDPYWHESWLPFMTHDAQRLYVDCDRTDQFGASPVRLVTWEWENFQVDRATSVAQLIRIWTWLLEQDLYRVVLDESGNAWWEPVEWTRVPEFLRRSGLA